jgi:urease accessory protein
MKRMTITTDPLAPREAHSGPAPAGDARPVIVRRLPAKAPALCALEMPRSDAGSAPALLRMLQLSSSLCPIGAFAYSQGLETAVERGWVTSEATLTDWMVGLGGHALSKLDLPLLLQAYAAAQAQDELQLLELAARVLASREARELAEQERQLGSALASVLVTLGVGPAEVFRGHAAASYVVSFALGALHLGLDEQLTMTGYSYAWCEQQVSAAARLVPLGHMAAQRALSAVLGHVPCWLACARTLPENQIGSSTPGLAMSLAWHETQYTRLFRS